MPPRSTALPSPPSRRPCSPAPPDERALVALIKRLAPNINRGLWAGLAIASAREAGLGDEDVASLRQNILNEFAIEDEDTARCKRKRLPTARLLRSAR